MFLLRERLLIWREVFWAPLPRIVVLLYGVLGLVSFSKSEFATPESQANYQFVRLIPLLSVQQWAYLGLVILVLLTLEGSYRVVSSRDRIIAELRPIFSLEQLLASLADEIRLNLDTRSPVPQRYWLDKMLAHLRSYEQALERGPLVKCITLLAMKYEDVSRFVEPLFGRGMPVIVMRPSYVLEAEDTGIRIERELGLQGVRNRDSYLDYYRTRRLTARRGLVCRLIEPDGSAATPTTFGAIHDMDYAAKVALFERYPGARTFWEQHITTLLSPQAVGMEG